LVVAIAWIYVVYESRRMTGMSMMSGWTSADVGLRFLMWTVMMIGMMVPTAIPMTLIYAAAARKAKAQGDPLAPTFVFVAGYVLVWTAFSVAATAGQWALERAALLSPAMKSNSAVLGGLMLLAAGVYQLTPLKTVCLDKCRSPAEMFSLYWRGSPIRLGMRYGLFCLGCCWVLMALLFVGGVMNLVWVATIAVFVLLEKTAPFGRMLGRLTGVGLVAAGIAAVGGLLTLG
jgi:predicted metal-binding membrane protein